MNPGEDGITHINIYSKAKTEIGRFLSNFSDCNVKTEDGIFRTVEGYWYWLSCKDERFRMTNGFQSKKLGRELRAPDWVKDPDFYRKIGMAITIKIISDREMSWKLVETGSLPLYHYYVYGGKIVMVKEGLWMINLIDHIRTELRTGVINGSQIFD